VGENPPVRMLRPKVKPEHAPYRIARGRKIRIGGVSYGLAAELADPDGWVWTMLAAMDGSRSLPEIVGHVHARHPGQPAGTLERGAGRLAASGYVEDAPGPVPASLTGRDLRRYDRALGYFRWPDLTPRASSREPQARLRDAREVKPHRHFVTAAGRGKGPAGGREPAADRHPQARPARDHAPVLVEQLTASVCAQPRTRPPGACRATAMRPPPASPGNITARRRNSRHGR
jgi:hypothetical protein